MEQYRGMPKLSPLATELLEHPFSVQQATRAGVKSGRLRSRDLLRPFYGVRATDAALLPTEHPVVDACRAFAPRLRPGEFFSHDTAARLWSAPLRDAFGPNERLHVSIPRPAGESRVRGIAGHKVLDPRVHIFTRFGLPVSDPESTFIACARSLANEDLVVLGDHLIFVPNIQDARGDRPYSSAGRLFQRVHDYEGPGKRAAGEALELVRQGAASRTETLLRLLIRDADLPEPVLNRPIVDASGVFLGFADMSYPEWRVIVEYDGDQHRTDTEQYEKDIVRRAAFAAAGWRAEYVRWRGLTVGRAETVASIEAALRSRGWSRQLSSHRQLRPAGRMSQIAR